MHASNNGDGQVFCFKNRTLLDVDFEMGTEFISLIRSRHFAEESYSFELVTKLNTCEINPLMAAQMSIVGIVKKTVCDIRP